MICVNLCLVTHVKHSSELLKTVSFRAVRADLECHRSQPESSHDHKGTTAVGDRRGLLRRLIVGNCAQVPH